MKSYTRGRIGVSLDEQIVITYSACAGAGAAADGGGAAAPAPNWRMWSRRNIGKLRFVFKNSIASYRPMLNAFGCSSPYASRSSSENDNCLFETFWKIKKFKQNKISPGSESVMSESVAESSKSRSTQRSFTFWLCSSLRMIEQCKSE